jgi:hypothetical protein
MKKFIIFILVLSCFSCSPKKEITSNPIPVEIQESVPELVLEVNSLGWVFEGVDSTGDNYYWDKETSQYGFFDSINNTWDYYIPQDLDKYLPNRSNK